MTPITQETLQTLELIRISCQPNHCCITYSDVKKHENWCIGSIHKLPFVISTQCIENKSFTWKTFDEWWRFTWDSIGSITIWFQKQYDYHNKIWFRLVRYANKTSNWNMFDYYLRALEMVHAEAEMVSKFLWCDLDEQYTCCTWDNYTFQSLNVIKKDKKR